MIINQTVLVAVMNLKGRANARRVQFVLVIVPVATSVQKIHPGFATFVQVTDVFVVNVMRMNARAKEIMILAMYLDAIVNVKSV